MGACAVASIYTSEMRFMFPMKLMEIIWIYSLILSALFCKGRLFCLTFLKTLGTEKFPEKNNYADDP